MAAPANLEKLLINALADRDAGRWLFNQLAGTQLGAPAGTGVTSSEGRGVITTTLTLVNVAVPTTDAGATGAGGGLKIFDFPEGYINILGLVSDLTLVASGLIGATAAVVAALGTGTAGADATLTGAEADIVPSTAATLVGSAADLDIEMITGKFLDGTATAKDMFLNFAMPDAGSTGAGTITVNGTITFSWSNLGNN